MMKKLFTTIILAFVCLNVSAQTPNWDWAKGSIGPGTANGYSTATDALGNTYVTGFFDSIITLGSLTLVDTFGLSMFIAKYDVFGNALWANTAGSIPNFFTTPRSDITTDAAGNVYVIGTHNPPFITFGTYTLPNYGMHLVKYSSSGTVLWAKGVENTSATGVATDALGNVIVTGIFNTDVTFGAFTLTNADTAANTTDIFVVKYDATGNVIWAKSEGSQGREELPMVSTDSFNNVYVTGAFGYISTLTIGTYTLTNSNNNGYDIFIVKYNAMGNVLWAKSAGGQGPSDYALSIASDGAGNAYLTGRYYSPSITFGNTTLFNTDTSSTTVDFESFIVKYDALGNMEWAHGIGGTNWDYGNDITTDVYGNIYVTGLYADSITFGATTLSNVSPGVWNIFIAKYNTAGNVLWAKAAGGSGNDYVQGISTDAVGNIYITGSYLSLSMIFGQDTLTNNGSYQMFIAKLGSAIVGIEENNPIDEISIYPNPSNGIFNFKDTKDLKQVEVYNLLGEQILSQSNQKQINLSGYAKGIYYARINGEVVVKLVKE